MQARLLWGPSSRISGSLTAVVVGLLNPWPSLLADGFHQTGSEEKVITTNVVLTEDSSFETGVRISGPVADGGASLTMGSGVTLTGLSPSGSSSISVGAGPNAKGMLNLSSGSALIFDTSATGSGYQSLYLGMDGGTGYLMMSGGEIKNAPNSKSYSRIWVGTTEGSAGHFYQSGGTVHNGVGSFYVGVNGSTGYYELSNDAEANLGITVRLGHGTGGLGTVVVKDQAKMVMQYNDAWFNIGYGGNSTVTQSGNSSVTIDIGGVAGFGYGTGSTGIYRLEGGTLTFSALGADAGYGTKIGQTAGSVGGFAQTGGTSYFGKSAVALGEAGQGTFTLQGGEAALQHGMTLGRLAGSEGTLNLEGGTLSIGKKDGLKKGAGSATFNWSGGTLQMLETGVVVAVDANVQKSEAVGLDGPVFDTGNYNATMSGRILGDGVLVKTGAGTLTLTGDNNLTRGDAMTSSDKAEFYVVKGAVAQTAGNSTIDHLVVGSGGGANGAYTLSNGSLTTRNGLQVGDSGGIGSFTQTGGTILSIGSTNIGNQGGTGEFNLSGGTFTQAEGFANVGRSTQAANSQGTLNISGTGTFVVSTGADLIVGDREGTGAHATGVLNQTGGTMRVENGGQLWVGGYGDGTYNFTGGTLEVGGSQSLNGRYGGEAATGASYFNLAGGTIKATSNLATNIRPNVIAGTTSTIDTHGHDATFHGGFDGGGTLQKVGVGTLTVGGTGSFSGEFAVREGGAKLNGDLSHATLTIADGAFAGGGGTVGDVVVLDGGLLEFGWIDGKLDIAGDLTLSSSSTLLLNFANLAQLSGLSVGGTLSAGGTLQLEFGTKSVVGYPTNIALFSAGAFEGSFSSILLPELANGYQWDTSALTTTGYLSVAAVPEPSTWAAICGAAALGLALWRRRNRRR